MTKRRAKGEGTVVRRGDGSWMYSIDVGLDESGKRRRRSLYGRTRAEVLRKAHDLRAKSGGSIRPRAKGTVSEWVERWLRDDVQPNLAHATHAAYRRAWLHAAPIVGALALERFDPDDVATLYARLRERGVGGRSIQLVGAAMRRAFSVAIRRRAYQRANPFSLVDQPRHQTAEARVLDFEEARKFIDAVQGDRYEALWLTCLTGGLRLGEALGLEWSDVDLDAGIISVRQQVAQPDGGRSEVGPLKTRSSRRVVQIGRIATEALRRRRRAADGEEHGSTFVFVTVTGAHPNRSNLRRDSFRPACVRAGIEGLVPHGLRHSMTSFAIASGLSPKTVAERLGHATTRMTLDRYAHVLPGMQRQAADQIDALLKPPKGRPSLSDTRK